MKLLFDANLAPKLAQLENMFPGSVHVEMIGLGATDTEIWSYAKAHGFAIVSKDSDFEQRALVFGAPPKVIWIRLGNCRTGVVESLLRQRFDDIIGFEADSHESILALP